MAYSHLMRGNTAATWIGLTQKPLLARLCVGGSGVGPGTREKQTDA